MKKKIMTILVMLFPYIAISQELPRNGYSRYTSEKRIPDRYELLLNAPKIKLEKLNVVPDYDLLLDQRLVFLPGRSVSSYNQKYKFAGVSLGNGLFLDADYNLGLSLEKLFKENLNNKKSYKVAVTKYRSGMAFEQDEYIREESVLKEMKRGKPAFQVDFKDGEIHINKYRGIMKVVDGRLMYFLISRDGKPEMGQIARDKNTVVYQLDNPSSRITLTETGLEAEVPSDFFFSDVYEFRTYKNLKISTKGEVISIKSSSLTAERNISLFQNQDGLYIISDSGNSYRISKGTDNKISVYQLLLKGDRLLLQVEFITSEVQKAKKN